MNIDIHVHSKHSTRPSQWFLQKLGCPESFTEPKKIYDIARRKGMSLVTISDHNSIRGALEIAHLPGTFVSEEITSYFPEDGCKVHVLALNITEAMHEDIQKVRENVYDLAAWLRGNKVVHVLAHPLFGVNDKLTPWHFERMLLLFETFELNGSRDDRQNGMLKDILARLSPRDMERLADRHGLEPCGDKPWKKGLAAGSDDHGALTIANMHTHVPGATDLDGFLDGLVQGRGQPRGRAASPKGMAHNLYAIAYQFYSAKLGLERYRDKDLFLKFLDRFLGANPQDEAGLSFTLQSLWSGVRRSARRSRPTGLPDLVRSQAESLIHQDPQLFALAKSGLKTPGGFEEQWFGFVTRISNTVLSEFGGRFLEQLRGANLFDVFNGLGSAGALYTMLAPYFVAYSVFTKDRAFCREVHEARCGGPGERPVKVAHFSDTVHDLNGVALTLRMHVQMAAKHGKELTVVTCGEATAPEHPMIKRFDPVGRYNLEEYPNQPICCPPLLDMLAYVYEQGFTHLHSATPGPIGLAALGIARILRLPISGTYHTAFPQYAKVLTGDDAMEELTWKYMAWYYNRMDKVFVPSEHTGRELEARGILPEKITLFSRGVDTERFHPAKRGGLPKSWGVESGQVILYVGRISKEKNLNILAEAFLLARKARPDLSLVVTGEGPYEAEMRRLLHGERAVFTGVLQGEELAGLFASCDLFVFPSTTDTFGNVVLEAQASGLPVIVSDQGGPQENVIEGETGRVVADIDPQSLARAILETLRDEHRLARMRRGARKAMEGRSFDAAFMKTWELYKTAC